jgi:outer membrane protein assembly factor BamB
MALTIVPAHLAFSDDWPQFRGPGRDGISHETGLISTWPDKGPKVLWRRPLGSGFSGISAVGGKLFTMYADGKTEWLTAIDAGTGRQLWKVHVDSNFSNDQGDGPRATPTVDAGVVYAVGAKGRLLAVSMEDGRELWKKDLKAEVSAKVPTWGVSTSPLVEGDLLILDAGGRPDASLVAFNRETGELVWAAGSDQAGYSAPVAINVGGVRQILSFSGTQISSVTPTKGEILWTKDWRTSWDVNAATPIFIHPDKVFVASGYDTGAALLKISANGAGARTEEVWRTPAMKNQFSSSVYVNGYIYGFDNSTLKAIDAATGKDTWKERPGLGHGSLFYADGKLIILGERGKLVLIDADPNGFKARGQFQILTGKCWTVPTLSTGRLFLRNEKELVALDFRG